MKYLDDRNVLVYQQFEILYKLSVKSLIPIFICPVYVGDVEVILVSNYDKFVTKMANKLKFPINRYARNLFAFPLCKISNDKLQTLQVPTVYVLEQK